MKEKLASLVSITKSLAYLFVALGVSYTYLQKDFIFGEIARLSSPYMESYVETSVNNTVPGALIKAMAQDSIKVYIDNDQWEQLDSKLLDNKLSILEAIPTISKKESKRVLHNFLIVERELHNPMNGDTYYLKGILLGKRDDGQDDWIWRISETRDKN